MTKTFTIDEVIDLTYGHRQSTSVHSLDWFMEQTNLRPFKGASSCFIHKATDPDADLMIAIEAYDDDFYDVTETETKRDAFQQRVYNQLAKLFPDMTIYVAWYSGFDYHVYQLLQTTNTQLTVF